MKTLWYFPLAVLVNMSIVVGSVQAQDAQDCAKCDTKTGPYNDFSINQAVCAGANAIVCERRFQKQYDSNCVAGTAVLRDCTEVVQQMLYQTLLFPLNTCGTATRDVNGNIISTTCGAPGPNAGAQIQDDFHTCTGNSWLISMLLPLNQRYALEISSPLGLTLTNELGIVSLAETLIEIPAGLFELPNDELVLDGDVIKFGMTVGHTDNAIFTIPDQTFKATQENDALKVESSTVRDGLLVLELAIRQPNLGAFKSYVLNLSGLQVQANSATPAHIKAPEGDELEPSDDPFSLRLAATVSGVSQVLATGTGIVAKFVTEPAPPAEPTRNLLVLLVVASSLGVLLVASWLFFFMRRKKQA